MSKQWGHLTRWLPCYDNQEMLMAALFSFLRREENLHNYFLKDNITKKDTDTLTHEHVLFTETLKLRQRTSLGVSIQPRA
jgi:hypothetical protein